MTARSGPDRRTFLAMAGAGMLASPAVGQVGGGRVKDPVIVNALGGFGNPNAPRRSGAIQGTHRSILEDRVLDDARASGLTAVNVTLGYVAGEMDPFEHSVSEIGIWERRLRHHQDRLTRILSAADILRARDEGRIGVIYGFQNGEMLSDDPSRAEIFANLGVRIIQLTYNPANRLGDGSMAPGNRGLTARGRDVIEQLNLNRIIVDLSHSGEQTCLEATSHSRQPVSINHTGCRALTDLPRNKSDSELRAVAERGGFVGIYFMPFLSPDSVASADQVVAHIEHAVKICGEDHVGIGTDGGTTAVDDMAAYRARIRQEIEERRAAGIGAAGENPDTLPFVENLSGPGQFQELIARLERRNHPASRIEKILGLNFLRHARLVWGE